MADDNRSGVTGKASDVALRGKIAIARVSIGQRALLAGPFRPARDGLSPARIAHGTRSLGEKSPSHNGEGWGDKPGHLAKARRPDA